MKKNFLSSCLLALAACLRAAEPTGANPPATNSFVVAKIPDAAHEPVRVTNTVTIAGERVTYVAETGMLPILKADGTSRASVFLRRLHAAGHDEHCGATGDILLQWRAGFGLGLAASRRARPAPRENEP